MLTSRQLLVVSLALIESFALSAHYAVFMPFYPNVALAKGNSHSEVGAFFAVGSLVGLVGSPFVGWLLKRGVPPKNLVIFGLMLSGVLLAAHGFYRDLLVDSRDFFYVNLFTRILHSVGPVAATTSIYPIVAVEMGAARSIYLPLIEAAYNMGLMLWPSIGAMLYDQFGYMFPFVSVGLLAVVLGLVIAVFLPKTEKSPASHVQAEVGFDKIDFRLLLILLNIAMCYLIIGFNDITLSTELARFQLSHTKIGYCFAVATVCYGVCIYLWGFVCRSYSGRYTAQGVGYALTIMGLFLLGPCELIGIDATLWLRLGGQALIGVGLAGLFTASMISGMNYLTHGLDLADDVATHGFFSGLIFFALCAGYLVGHACFAGIVQELLGYSLAVMAIIGSIVALMLLDGVNLIVRCCSSPLRPGYKRIGSEEPA